ncbi:hypothetical protein BDV39DRAFT_194385 [Aspergillus sergii]|uniref:F-box domain-containing protein n=1 Tax=Aspergillus sergii TaxID=1034303 RepID=A0A5N6WWW5_9EURO|nr:hypothetical protein BDV39DRAFT_194385 [Aspergillus sergii]
MVYINHTQLRGPAKITRISHDKLSGTTLGYPGGSSAGSSVASLCSPSVAASSAGSSEILVGLGISTTTPGLKVEDRPSRGYCVGGNDPARLQNQLDKPLPPLPLRASARDHGLVKHYPLPPRPQGRKHWSLPNKPEAHDLAALDHAFARKGLRSNPLHRLRVHRPRRDLPTVANIEHTEPTPDRLTSRRWLVRGRTLTRIFQQFRRPRLPQNPSHGVRQSTDPGGEASTQPPLCHTLSRTTGPNGPPIHAHSGAATRMKRILSILLENRASLCMPDMPEADRERYASNFIEQAQRLLLDHLQPTLPTPGSGSHTQGSLSTAGPGFAGPIVPVPRPRHSIYELDVRPQVLSNPCASSVWNVPVPVMLQILQQVDCLEDLFSLALVNRAAYKAFKAHELPLIQGTLWKVSPPAWELRQVCEIPIRYAKEDSDGSPLAASLYLRHYARDLDTLVRIKLLIWYYCRAVVREGMMKALCDPDSEQGAAVDDAIWRVWTFCHLFGSRKDREWDLAGQIRWLRGKTCGTGLPLVSCTSPDPSDFNTVLFTPPEGFARGNQGPLSEDQLCDMIEVWTAMASLLDFLRVQTSHARRYGVFNETGVTPGDKQQEEFMLSRFPLLSFIRSLTYLTLGTSIYLLYRRLARLYPYSWSGRGPGAGAIWAQNTSQISAIRWKSA